ncbi:hypothetical protein [Pseudoalteromonas viridis]|uniref:Uncharacterized protein n=1 Tax=Pseudoalteromonas viridis TaxID=339617 RepID=A0ABX7V6N0_9GAMM|nr:hypothetical protein [Pseudoalteromonas viridis]QTL36566.1 hypothetical protein J5X90_05875 [Pseudoalteromonas viridis]
MASVTDLESTLSCKDQVSYEPSSKDVRITDALASIHDAKCVVQLTTFDEYGRVFQQFDDYRRTRERGRFVEARGQRLYYRAEGVTRTPTQNRRHSVRIFGWVMRWTLRNRR